MTNKQESLLGYVEDPSILKPKHSSFTATTISIIKCFVGAASLELPGAILSGGLVGSLVGIFVLASVSFYTLRILARCGELTSMDRTATYPEIGYAAFGGVGWFLSWLGVVFMTVGVCTAYFVFVANTMVELMEPINPVFQRTNSILILLPCFIALSLGPYKHLSGFSIIGISALVFALVSVFIEAFQNNTMEPSLESYPAFAWETYPLFLGNTAFVYLIHSVVLPMRNKMEKPKFCPRTLAIAISIVTVLNLAFAVPVYLLYGDATQGNIVSNMRPGTLKTAVQIGLCVDLFFTYALFLFPMCDALENDISRLNSDR